MTKTRTKNSTNDFAARLKGVRPRHTFWHKVTGQRFEVDAVDRLGASIDSTFVRLRQGDRTLMVSVPELFSGYKRQKPANLNPTAVLAKPYP